MADRPREVVLVSGGIDSGCLLAERVAAGSVPDALFVDYGQPPVKAEREASRCLARTLTAPWSEVRVGGLEVSDGEIAGRNALLAHLALTWIGHCGAALIFLGIHAGTPYRDCSSSFVEETQRSLDFQSGGGVRLVAPFVDWPKQLIVDRAHELGLPLRQTHSCERGDNACDECASCIDRRGTA